MRKMFTRLFGLALLLCLLGAVTDVSAQCNVVITASDVELVTDPADVCDSAYITYQVVGLNNAEYAFNLDNDPGGWGGFTTDSTVSVQEGVPFQVVVRVNDTCYSNELTYTEVNLIEPVAIDTSEVEQPQCYGENGEVTIKFTGDHGPYTYYFVPEADWVGEQAYPGNTVGSTQVIAGPGTYYVSIQDANDCIDLTQVAAWDTAVINAAPAMLVVDTIYGTDPACVGEDGTVTVVVSGGTPDTDGEYEVTVGGETMTTTLDTALFMLPEGSYQANVVDSFGCSTLSDSTVTLTDPEAITFKISIEDVSCGDTLVNDGVIKVFDFLPAGVDYWAKVGDSIWIQAVDDTVTINNLQPIYYSLFVDNTADLCDSVAYDNPNGTGNVISVQSPGEIMYTVTYNDTIACYGDSTMITVSGVTGGNGSYEYYLQSDDDGVISNWGSTYEWNVPEADNYLVSVRDADETSCAVPYPAFDIDQIGLVTITAVDTISPTCPGGNDGVINITAAGGNGTYEYSIDNSAWYTNNIFAVAAGEYTVYARDPLCEDQVVSQDVMIDTLDANVIFINDKDTAIECNGAGNGWAEIQVVTWANQTGSDSRVVSIYMTTDVDEIYVSGDSTTNGDYENLDPGTYYFWAADNLGCVSENTLTVTVTEADALGIIGMVTDNASCYGDNDGVLSVKLTGGTSPFTYGHANTFLAAMNLPGAAFTAWPVDADSVNIQVGKGTYYVVVKDNCGKKVAAGPFTVEGKDMVTIADTALFVTDIVCAGDSVGVIEVAAAEGGSNPDSLVYTLQVEDEGWVNVAGYVEVTETVFTGLPYGTYQVVVTDLGGCDGTATGTIEVDGPTEEVVFVDWDSEDITCNGASDGTIWIEAYGGTAPYEFKVGTAGWRAFPEGSDEKTIVVTESGEYEVWIRDSLGCTSESRTFIILEPDPIVVTVVETDATVACDDDGALVITWTGGHDWTWDADIYINDVKVGNHESKGDPISYLGLEGGSYEIMVIENHNEPDSCKGYATAVILQPDTITAIATVTEQVLCNGDSTGVITVSDIMGGNEDYTINMIYPAVQVGEQDSNIFSELPAGFYIIEVTDFSCTLTLDTLVITEPVALELTAEHIADITCAASGQFSVTATGGVGDYKYFAALSALPAHILIPDSGDAAWQTDSIFTVTEAGTYIVWAMDANECVIGGEENDLGQVVNEWRVQILAPSVVVTVDLDDQMVDCNGDMTAMITVGDANVTIEVDEVVADRGYTVTIHGVATDTLSDLGAGTYVVVVTDTLSGCSGTDTVEIGENDVLEAILEVADGEFSCPDVTEGYIEVTATGGEISLPPTAVVEKSASIGAPFIGYMYQLWQDGILKTDYQNENSFLVTIGHSYTVVVKDANGCTDTTDVMPIDPVAPIEFSVMDVTCSSDSLGSVKVDVTGEEGRMFQVQWTQFEAESGVYSDTSAWYPAGSIFVDQKFKFDNENITDIHYEITVIDDKGCISGTDTLTIDQIISSPLELTVTEGSVNSCGTDVTITAAGGVAPYVIMVDDMEVTEDMVVVGGGMHTVKVMDAHECMVMEEITLAYPMSADTALVVYTGEAVQLVVEDMLDTMLYAGEYSFYYDVDTACVAELNVVVTEKDRMQPVIATVTPMDTIADNHPTFVITFDGPVAFNDSVVGYLTVTPKDSTEALLVIEVTSDMVVGNTITIDYVLAEGASGLDKNSTYVVAVDSGIVMGDGLAWDGEVVDWMFTTGEDFATSVKPSFDAVEFNVYPNPFSDRIIIDNNQILTRVVISNIAGQRVLDVEYPEHVVRTNNLVSGLYFVSMFTEEGIVKTSKLIKK